MDQNKKHELLLKVIAAFGVIPQVEMAHEEMGELLQALNKLKRLTPKNEPFGTKPQAHHSIKYCLAYWNVCSEIADLKILLDQLTNIFSSEGVEISEDRKLTRLEDRLNKNTY